MEKIGCIYSSGGGNSRLVVDYLSDLLTSNGIVLDVTNALVAQKNDITAYKKTLLVAPTYDHGVLHAPYETYIQLLGDVDLSGYAYYIVGLGNDTYDSEYTCESAQILKDFVLSHGGTVIGEPLRINKHPISFLNTDVDSRVASTFFTVTEHDHE